MESGVIRILLVDDEYDDYIITTHLLGMMKNMEFKLEWTQFYDDALAKMEQRTHDVYLIDYFLGDRDGLELIKEVSLHHKLPIILLTGQGSEKVAVQAMKLDIQDYVVKGKITPAALKRSINNAMVKVALQKKIEEQRRELEEMHYNLLAQLDQARKAQHSIVLPTKLPPTPGLSIAVKYAPAEQVSGDLYDLFALPNEQTGIVISDVTGHGIPAALLTFMISGLFKSMVPQANDSQSTIQMVNGALHGEIPQSMFATCIYGVYSPHAKTFSFTSAGHPPAYLIKSNPVEIIELRGKGTMLGPFSNADANFNEQCISLASGDKVLLYTDGIIEPRNGENRMFGKANFKQCLLDHAQLGVEPFLEAVYDSVEDFSDGKPMGDDITLVAFEVLD